MPEFFAPTHQTLCDIRNRLEKLSLTQAWSLRETDLYDFQRQLDKIDESRVNGNFLDDEGKPTELYVQRVCLKMLLKRETLLTVVDTAILNQTKLRLHLLPHGFFRTGVRSSPTCVQPTSNVEAMPYRGQELWRSQFATRTVSI